jgi:hypothetical protein
MRTFIGVLAFLVSSSFASGQVAEFSLSGGLSQFGDATLLTNPRVTLGDGFRLGLRMTFNSGRFTGHEIGYGYSRTNVEIAGPEGGEIGMNAHGVFYDFLIYGTPEGTRFRPFACGGAQFNSFFPPGTSVYYGNQVTKFGFNYGGGVKAVISGPWGVRFDIRQYASGKPDLFQTAEGPSGWMRQTEYTAGISFNF